MGINKTKLLRPKRMTFQFVEEGKWTKQAEIMKFKVCYKTLFSCLVSISKNPIYCQLYFVFDSLFLQSQFGEAQAKELRMKQTQLEKAKAEPEINPNLIAVGVRIKKEKLKDEIPELEWW